MIVPEVPEFVINPENVRQAINVLMSLAFIGGAGGGAVGSFVVGVAGVIKEVFNPSKMDEEVKIREVLRFINTAIGMGVAVGSIGTPIAAIMFSR